MKQNETTNSAEGTQMEEDQNPLLQENTRKCFVRHLCSLFTKIFYKDQSQREVGLANLREVSNLDEGRIQDLQSSLDELPKLWERRIGAAARRALTFTKEDAILNAMSKEIEYQCSSWIEQVTRIATEIFKDENSELHKEAVQFAIKAAQESHTHCRELSDNTKRNISSLLADKSSSAKSSNSSVLHPLSPTNQQKDARETSLVQQSFQNAFQRHPLVPVEQQSFDFSSRDFSSRGKKKRPFLVPGSEKIIPGAQRSPPSEGLSRQEKDSAKISTGSMVFGQHHLASGDNQLMHHAWPTPPQQWSPSSSSNNTQSSSGSSNCKKQRMQSSFVPIDPPPRTSAHGTYASMAPTSVTKRIVAHRLEQMQPANSMPQMNTAAPHLQEKMLPKDYAQSSGGAKLDFLSDSEMVVSRSSPAGITGSSDSNESVGSAEVTSEADFLGFTSPVTPDVVVREALELIEKQGGYFIHPMLDEEEEVDLFRWCTDPEDWGEIWDSGRAEDALWSVVA